MKPLHYFVILFHASTCVGMVVHKELGNNFHSVPGEKKGGVGVSRCGNNQKARGRPRPGKCGNPSRCGCKFQRDLACHITAIMLSTDATPCLSAIYTWPCRHTYPSAGKIGHFVRENGKTGEILPIGHPFKPTPIRIRPGP